ncbi:MAG TPA: hypothetical protein IAD02_03890 [Candidatus Enterousia intestinigallinarum]|uniref:Uncharacterized protein n=1 Tax=Candidatus Enterousia intestinigallinarum TaxID=2840790 RepID=A0A9D1JX21_9PROT|nr:hypothetical protein [Candidatus Enterousia intestinigallinarum]
MSNAAPNEPTEYTCNCGSDYKEWNVLYNNLDMCTSSSDTSCIVSATEDTFVYRASYEAEETGCSVCMCEYNFPIYDWEADPYLDGVVRKKHFVFTGGYLEKYCTVSQIGDDRACASGWYVTYYEPSIGGTDIGCKECPSFIDLWGSQYRTTSSEANLDDITGCYMEPGTGIYDETGIYDLTQKCYYSE